jgi:hypothetical protein
MRKSKKKSMVKNIGATRIWTVFVLVSGILFFPVFFLNAEAFVSGSEMTPERNDTGQYFYYPYTSSGEGSVGTVSPTDSTGVSPFMPVSGTGFLPGMGGKVSDEVPPTAPTNLLAGQADGKNAVLLCGTHLGMLPGCKNISYIGMVSNWPIRRRRGTWIRRSLSVVNIFISLSHRMQLETYLRGAKPRLCLSRSRSSRFPVSHPARRDGEW